MFINESAHKGEKGEVEEEKWIFLTFELAGVWDKKLFLTSLSNNFF